MCIRDRLKEAVRVAESAGTLGTILHKLFQRSFAVAKEVRTNTQVGANSVSMAAAAVKLAGRIFPSLAEQKVLLVGAGEMIELAATHFAGRKPRSITVANRTLERGNQLASRFAADAITLTELNERLAQFDIIVTCTASTLPIIGKGTLERVVKQRKHAPVLIVDLGVPRDVEAEATALDDVFLYSVDDLAEIVKDNLQIRREAVLQAEQMIAEQTAHFLRWLQGRTVVPTIAALNAHHETLKNVELDRARRMLASGASPQDALDALARGLTSKLLHPSLAALNAAGEAERAELIALFSRIYGLSEPPAET